MARREFPTLEQVTQLPLLVRMVIPPDYEDLNGHVNIQHYLGIYSEAGWPFFALLGMDERMFTVERRGIFDLEHHLYYLAEIHIGDEVAVYGRMLGRKPRLLHGIWFIVNETRRELANTFEFISASADLERRQVVPFAENLASRLDAMIADHARLDWPPPVCGVMGL